MNTDTIVADSLSRDLPVLKPRTASLETVPGMASVVIGMRRSGKTCLLFREIERLLAEGVERSRILYVNLEDDRLYPIQDNILPDILESFYRQTAAPRDSRVFIFLDEVQAVQGWSRFARRILDTERSIPLTPGFPLHFPHRAHRTLEDALRKRSFCSSEEGRHPQDLPLSATTERKAARRSISFSETRTPEWHGS